tara:strand:- start:536 stop:1174 length:639 start_codon:yes stop_codon:yes gene_type:complete
MLEHVRRVAGGLTAAFVLMTVLNEPPAKPAQPPVDFPSDPSYVTFSSENPMLKGQALLTEFSIGAAQGMSKTDLCLSCGYVTEAGRPAFTDFYTAILEARGHDMNPRAGEVTELLEEYKDFSEAEVLDRLVEDYDVNALKSFIEVFGIQALPSFEDAYQGEYDSGADFAEQFVTDCYSCDVPGFVDIDWEGTWANLRHDYIIEEGFVFALNF